MSDRPIIVKSDGCGSCLWTGFKIVMILIAINLCVTVFIMASASGG